VVVANVDMACPDMILGGFVISGYDPPSEISDGLFQIKLLKDKKVVISNLLI
jgi:hypothetical protein